MRGDSRTPTRKVPLVSMSAAKKADGGIIVSLANVSLDKAQEVEISLDGYQARKATGKLLTCKQITDYNDFEHPDRVAPAAMKDLKVKKNTLKVKLPAKSIAVIEL